MTVHIDVLTTIQELNNVRAQLVRVYQDVFSRPPWNEPPEAVSAFAERALLHAQRPAFRCVTAYHTDGGDLVGFAYGYTSASGQWWHDTITAVLSAEEVEQWFSNAFELVELAVLPTAQGQGIGGQLHDRIFAGIPHRTAVTATRQEANPAVHFYRKRQWVPIRTYFMYPDSRIPNIIFGRILQ